VVCVGGGGGGGGLGGGVGGGGSQKKIGGGVMGDLGRKEYPRILTTQTGERYQLKTTNTHS